MITWYNNQLADAGFVINLQERSDRLEKAISQLEIVNIKGVQQFNAVKIPESNSGCTQSHIEIAKIQIKNNWDYVLYLEDDIEADVFYDISADNVDIETVAKNITKDLRKYKPDVLWLGVRPEGAVQKISNMFVKPTKTVMSHAYIGSLKYAKFLVNNLTWRDRGSAMSDWPIDFFISELNNKQDWKLHCDQLSGSGNILNNDLKIYMTLPNIFVQGPSYSDIAKQFTDYRPWIKGCFKQYINLDKLAIKKFLNNE